MADVFDIVKRSEVMSQIRSRGNKDTEYALMYLLKRNRIAGWRRHQLLRFNVKKVKGLFKSEYSGRLQTTPDFVFRICRLAIFVDGCFWHECPKHFKLPTNNRNFWIKKLMGNVARDRRVDRMLRLHGWCVIRVWEHDLQQNRDKRILAEKKIVTRIRKILDSRSPKV